MLNGLAPQDVIGMVAQQVQYLQRKEGADVLSTCRHARSPEEDEEDVALHLGISSTLLIHLAEQLALTLPPPTVCARVYACMHVYATCTTLQDATVACVLCSLSGLHSIT